MYKIKIMLDLFIQYWYEGVLPLKRSSRFQCLFPNPSWLHYITLHYVISYANYTYSDQWCINKVIQSSPSASLKRWVFKSFLKVSVFVSSWRLDGREFHAFGPEYEKTPLAEL